MKRFSRLTITLAARRAALLPIRGRWSITPVSRRPYAQHLPHFPCLTSFVSRAQNHHFTYNERIGVESLAQSICDLALRFGEGGSDDGKSVMVRAIPRSFLCFSPPRRVGRLVLRFSLPVLTRPGLFCAPHAPLMPSHANQIPLGTRPIPPARSPSATPRPSAPAPRARSTRSRTATTRQ